MAATAPADRARAIEVMAGLLVDRGMTDRGLAMKAATGLVDEAISARDGTVSRAFSPGEPRDPHSGKWTRAPGGALGSAAGGAAGAALAASAHLRAESAGNDSVAKYMRPDGTWDPRRAALHEQIIGQALAGHRPHDNPTATFLGGGPASGKSTALAASKSEDQVHIDPDAIKEQLPEYGQMTKAGDKGAAAFAHEESSYLAKRIQAEAIARRMHFLLDGTGDSSYAKMLGKIEAAKAAGHRVVARYVTADTEEAVRRAKARAAKTGRLVPESVIREVHASVSDVFSRLVGAGVLDGAELWDTNGAKPALVGSMPPGGRWAVKNQSAWDRFIAKADAPPPS